MRDLVKLVCTECGSENYHTSKNKKLHPERMEVKKYCPKSRTYTVHKEKNKRFYNRFFSMIKTFIGLTSSNTYVWCRHQKCILIDPSDHLDEIHATLEGYQLEYIVLTHAHADHMHLLDQFDVPIYLHEKDFALLEKPGHIGYLKGFPYQLNTLNFKKMPEQLSLSDIIIDVIHTPGHSPGSVCLYYQDILIAGDTIFKESIGRTDLFLGSYDQLKKSIVSLMKLPMVTKIYPGHGAKTTIRHEKSHNLFVTKWLK